MGGILKIKKLIKGGVKMIVLCSLCGVKFDEKEEKFISDGNKYPDLHHYCYLCSLSLKYDTDRIEKDYNPKVIS